MNNDIIKVELVKGIRVQNTHNNFVFPRQNIMKVYFRNNATKILDLFSDKDITNIDYFKILEDKKTKTKVLFEEKEF